MSRVEQREMVHKEIVKVFEAVMEGETCLFHPILNDQSSDGPLPQSPSLAGWITRRGEEQFNPDKGSWTKLSKPQHNAI